MYSNKETSGNAQGSIHCGGCNLPLFDAHCDTLLEMQRKDQPLWKNTLHIDLSRGLRHTPWAQFFAMFELPPDHEVQMRDVPPGTRAFDVLYNIFQGALSANNDSMMLCRTARDAKTAELEGKLAAFLSIEGAEAIDCSLERLEEVHKLGVRMVTLTWNVPNVLSGTNVMETERGLSEQGRKFVRKCQELGVIVDVSHLSIPGFWDVAEELTVPFIASHSNSAKIWSHPRNLHDDQFQAIIRANGIAGINLYSVFLGDEPGIDHVIAHIEHFLSLGGEKHIALGADLDGCDALPHGIEGIQDVEKLAEAMLRRNYKEDLVWDMFYHNLMRVVGEICLT